MDQNNTATETIINAEALPAPEKKGIWIAGLIIAGFPSPAEEELRDVISFDDYLVPRPLSSFILHVSGDSMTGAGIMPGDLVIVEKGRVPKNGDIVIAEIDGDWTMKYFNKDKGHITLEAANPSYPSFSPRMELRLIGIVTACVRKFSL
jgi:SOS-response transcriptional repressor LexA